MRSWARKKSSSKGLRQWNQQVKNAMNEKTRTYHKCLQKKTEESKKMYEVKTVTSQYQQSWETFIHQIENYLHGGQTFAYKVINQMN